MDELIQHEYDSVEYAVNHVFPPLIGTLQGADISKILSYAKVVARIAIRKYLEVAHVSRSVESPSKVFNQNQ